MFPNDLNRTNLKMDIAKQQQILGNIRGKIGQANPQKTQAQQMTDYLLGALEASKDGVPVTVRNISP
jgi:hypothetical protein